jgi:hypothetical protein
LNRPTPPYRVQLGAISSKLPWLLQSFAAWLSTQPYGAVGCFAIEATMLSDEHLMSFATLPNDRQLGLDTVTGTVVLRWSNGAKRELAKSFGAFLVALSESNTGIIALDVGDSAARGELARWLRLNSAGRAGATKLKRDTEPNQTSR